MTEQVKDFAVKISVKNNRMLRAMRAAGYKTSTSLAAAVGTGPVMISEYLLFKRKPYSTIRGDWTELAYRISSALHVEPEDIWPQHIRNVKMKRHSVEIELDSDEVKTLSSNIKETINKQEFNKLFHVLSPREQVMIDRYMRGETPEELSKGSGVNGDDICHQRAHNLIQMAARKMRAYTLKNRLRRYDFIEK